jgi:hypothetical protein
MPRKLTMYEIKEQLKYINANIEILSEEYVNSKLPLMCKCLVDNNIFYMNWNNLYNKHGCDECALRKASTSIEYIETFIKNCGFELIDIENKHLPSANPNFQIIIKCQHGHVDKKSWRYFHNNRQVCKTCSKPKIINTLVNSRKVSIQSIVDYVKSCECKIIFGLEEYKTVNATNLAFQCKNGHQWFETFDEFKRHGGCPECKNIIKKHTYEDVVYYFKIMGCEVISEKHEYKGSKVPIWFVCTCGNVDKISFEEFKKHKRCVSCRGIYVSYNKDILENIFLQRNQILLTDKDTYKKSDRIRYICHCGTHYNKVLFDWFVTPQCGNCGLLNRSGEMHPEWNGGTSTLYKSLREQIKKWVRASEKFHKSKCIITGKQSTIVHHLYGFDLIMEETVKQTGIPLYSKIGQYTKDELIRVKEVCLALHYKYGYGVVLHPKIHDLFHLKYKYGKNTPDQFEEFKQRLKSGEFDTYLKDHDLTITI